jgi:hypothetical protein
MTREGNFGNRIGLAILMMLGLLALDRLPRYTGPSRTIRAVERVVKEMHSDELNAADLHILAAGYYEGLRNDVPVSQVNVQRNGMSTLQSDVRPRHDFLGYEFRPNVKRSYPGGMRITNSFGMASPEISREKPPHTRRIALSGDSLSVGPYGQDYVALLEDRLNRDCRTPEIQNFQVLNFSVYGYSVVQMMDVAMEKAPAFQPDVYLVALTGLEFIAGQGWRATVGDLVLKRIDLKYPFLRNVVAQSGVHPTDRMAVIAEKLEPFLIPVTRWSLEQIRDRAAAQDAQVIVAFIPGAINPDFTAGDFDRLHPAVDGLGVPVLDLRDTFRSVNLRDFQVAVGKDFHPNADGHKRIFENLYSELKSQPRAWAIVTGAAAAQTVPAPASPNSK